MIDRLVAISDILINLTVILHGEYSRPCDIPDDCDLGDKVDRYTCEWIDFRDGSREGGSSDTRPHGDPSE